MSLIVTHGENTHSFGAVQMLSGWDQKGLVKIL